MTPLDQLRLRLPDHDFARLMEAAKPITVPDRDAFLKDVAAELGQHEVVGPSLLHRIISEVQLRRRAAPTGTGWNLKPYLTPDSAPPACILSGARPGSIQ